MNATDQAELAITECPYCNEIMVNGKCRECEWEPRMEYPPMEEE
jgi:hypothetical protein